MTVNVKSAYLCAKYALPQLFSVGFGSIVNISSVAAMVGMRAAGNAYSASKGAVISFTRSLAVQVASKNIRVNCICPGYIRTPVTADSQDQFLTKVPLGRVGLPLQSIQSLPPELFDEASELVSGGLLSKGEPLGASSLGQLVEVTWQLRGDAGPRQVAGAKVGLCHSEGAGGNCSVIILKS